MVDDPPRDELLDLGFPVRSDDDLIDLVLVGYINNIFARILTSDKKVGLAGNTLFLQVFFNIIQTIFHLIDDLDIKMNPARKG